MSLKTGNLRYRQWIWLVALSVLTNCKNPTANQKVYDTPTSGTIQISVDESFKPVIDSQIKVFESSFPEAKIIAHYKAESECLKDLTNDSIRMVIVTKPLTRDDDKLLKEALGFTPQQEQLAYDAISVVVNNKSKDTIFDMADIRSMLKGTSGYPYKVVMDGLNSTSTVRYVQDSVLKGQAFGTNVVAATSSEGVIDYVAAHEDAIGFVGVNWIGDKNDSTQLSFSGKVKVVSLECGSCKPVAYTKPYQANIGLKRYPMVRSLYGIVKENYRGLGSGFANFLIYERGQLIFRKAYLWPSRVGLTIRTATINENE